jgi:hypothetical protein
MSIKVNHNFKARNALSLYKDTIEKLDGPLAIFIIDGGADPAEDALKDFQSYCAKKEYGFGYFQVLSGQDIDTAISTALKGLSAKPTDSDIACARDSMKLTFESVIQKATTVHLSGFQNVVIVDRPEALVEGLSKDAVRSNFDKLRSASRSSDAIILIYTADQKLRTLIEHYTD